MMQKKFIMREVFIFSQYDEYFKSVLKNFTISNEICGYLAILIAFAIEKSNFNSEMGFEEVNEILKNFDFKFGMNLEEIIKFIQVKRLKYIENQKLTVFDGKEYLNDLLANFEISDFLNQKSTKNVHFIRNLIDEESTKFEELERLNEEKPFKSEKCFIHDGEDGKFKNFKNWKSQHKKDKKIIFITNFSDHYGVLLPIKNGMILLNTLQTKYLTNEIPKFIFEEFFHQ